MFQSFVVFFIIQIVTVFIGLRFIILPRIEENLVVAEEIKTDRNLFYITTRFVTVQKIVRDSNNNILEERLSRYLKEFDEAISLAMNGQFKVERDDMGTFSIDLIKNANDSIIATSYVAPEEWWCTSWGKTYMQENYNAIKDRRVKKIRRFFLFESNEQLERYKPLLNDQAKHKVEVFHVLRKELPSKFTHDVIIVDGKIGGKLAVTPAQEMESAIMYTAPSDINKINSEIIRNLEVRATKFEYNKNIRKPACPS